MKFGSNIFIGIGVLAVILIGLFFVYGQKVNSSQSVGASVAIVPSTTGTIRAIKATISHSNGYLFEGDGASGTTITVNRGDTVKIITDDRQPSHNHGITIDEYGINQVTSQPGTVIQFVADKVGTFRIYCKTCDDGPLGDHPWMTGNLLVNQ